MRINQNGSFFALLDQRVWALSVRRCITITMGFHLQRVDRVCIGTGSDVNPYLAFSEVVYSKASSCRNLLPPVRAQNRPLLYTVKYCRQKKVKGRLKPNILLPSEAAYAGSSIDNFLY